MKTLATKDTIRSCIAFLHHQFLEKGDKQNAEKMLDLLEKSSTEEWIVSFSGHFSAGKSTMINRLLDHRLLPQSPIPTSANIVKVSAGEPGIEVYYNNKKREIYPPATDIETIQQLCRDGELIRRIDISKEADSLPERVSIMDTPGIDSANDADRVITESSLHLVDLVVYVMDYNHVQSEVNLKFLREMQKRNKPVYIVVNQVDKHIESEITFEAFQSSVLSIFEDWSIRPEQLFFTSLSQKSVRNNQWEEFKEKLQQRMRKKETEVVQTITNSISAIIDSHLQKQKEQLEENFPGFSSEDNEVLQTELVKLEEGQQQRTKEMEKLEKSYRLLLDTTTKNALLMPFEVREKAESFLQAYQSDFRPGMFASKKKIEKIREERKEAFHAMVQEKITANLDWKLKEKVIEFIKQQEQIDNVFLENVQAAEVKYNAEKLENLIKPGARITPEYLLRYTEEVSNDIKNTYKKVYMDIWKKIKKTLELTDTAIKEEENEKLEKLRRDFQLAESVKKEKKIFEEYKTSLVKSVDQPVFNWEFMQGAEKKLEERKSAFRHFSGPVERASSTSKEETVFQEAAELSGAEHNMDKKEEELLKAEKIFKGLKGFESLASAIEAKRNRLENRNFTIALFGAFSAGKSSFANALLGEGVLPVSPNPTTAVINKISPVTATHPHGSVAAKVKSEQDIVADLENLEVEVPGGNLEEKIKALEVLLKKDEAAVSIREQAFLQAIADGYPPLAGKLGKEITIDLDQFAEYVATESIACYLEWTELYFDCSLTRQGISLIDTPGADSINSRHTDLSFEYIKEADAILFVTYYNHAFSKADSDFLLQLGRVKDEFSLDKMFFIINASDLAENKDELKMVTNYVSDQLVKFGIRQPRMFPLSSKQGLQEKQRGTVASVSGLPEFEKSFYYFLHSELAEVLIRSAFHDVKRGSRQLESFIESASLETKEKEELAEKLRLEKKELIQQIKENSGSGIQEEITQKLDKQLYYVLERDGILFNDRFKAFFNPTTVTSSGTAAKQEAEENILALTRETAFQLSQEVRAVSVRMENFLNKKAEEYTKLLEETAKKKKTTILFPQWESKKVNSFKVRQGLKEIKKEDFKQSLSVFKSQKTIIDRGEREKFKESFYEELRPYMENYLEEWKERMNQFYQVEWQKLQEEVQVNGCTAAGEFYDGILYNLSDRIDVDKLMEASNQINRLMD